MDWEQDNQLRKQYARIANDGNEYASNGDFLKAVHCYSEAIHQGIYCNEFGLYLNRALCYLKMGFFHLALLDVNEATRLADQNFKCYYIRSQVLIKLNEFKLAENDLQLAGKLKPDCEDIGEELNRIRDRIKKEKQLKETQMLKEKLSSYDLSDKTYYKIKVNFHLVAACDLPTNIWNYEGIRVNNIRPDVSGDVIQNLFSVFGNILNFKWVYPRVRIGNPSLLIHYYNPVTPMFTIAYFQKKIFKELCSIEPADNSYKELVLYFAPTSSQFGLRFSRPKYPILKSDECYFWRTTTCQLKEKCSKKHIPENKNIDLQIWMIDPNRTTNNED